MRPSPLPALLSLRGGVVSEVAVTGLAGATTSLTKNIIGVSVLTLASGMAAGTGVGPATIAMIAAHAACAYSFALIGQLCDASGLGMSCSLDQLWATTLGGRSAWLMSATACSLTFSMCTVYLLCLGELLPPLLSLLGAPPALRTRRGAVCVTASLVMPLCFARSLAGLSAVASIGMVAILYTVLFSIVRCFDGSYHPGGRYHDSMPARLRPDLVGLQPWRLSGETAVLFANLGGCLCVHFNAPGFYRSLADATSARFSAMTYAAFGVVLLISILLGHSGYYTFGRACQPMILSNYHPTDDHAATAARLATAASLITSFPLVFSGLREAALSAASPLVARLWPAAGDDAVWRAATLLLPSLALAIALVVEDLGLAVGLLGSVLGGALMFVVPAAMHAKHLLGSPGSRGRSLALAVDAALVLYGVLGQMLFGSVICVSQRAKRAQEHISR